MRIFNGIKYRYGNNGFFGWCTCWGKGRKDGMMADLIDREKTKAAFEPWLNVKGYSKGELNIIRAVLYEITIMPSAQPDVPDTTFGNMISRQAAIDTVRSYYDEGDEREESIEERIEQLPSADIDLSGFSDKLWRAAYERGKAEAVRHGHWIRGSGYPHRIFCSICYATYVPNDEWDIWKTDGSDCFRLQRNFCPYCGAKMDEVEQ